MMVKSNEFAKIFIYSIYYSVEGDMVEVFSIVLNVNFITTSKVGSNK